MGVVGARGLLAGLDVEGGVHGCALVVGVGVGVDGEVGLVFGLELLPQLADQLVLPLVLVLEVEDVRLKGYLFVPDAAVVVPQVGILAVLCREIVDEGGTLAQDRRGNGLTLLLSVDLRYVVVLRGMVIFPLPGFQIPLVPFFFPLRRVEVSDDLGLLCDEVELIPLQLLNHAVTDNHIFLPRSTPPPLHHHSHPLHQVLCLSLIQHRHCPAPKRSAPQPSNHDYNNRWRTRRRGSIAKNGAFGISRERRSRSARR